MKLLLIAVLLFGSPLSKAQYAESDWAARNLWIDVPRILKLAEVTQGDAVADIGCHEGYFSMHLARKVGGDGKVFAVDIRDDRLERLATHAKDRRLANIETVLGENNNPRLPENTLDVAFIIDAYHEMENYMLVLRHVKEALKPGGRIVVLEKLKAHARGKSRQEQVASHTLSATYVKRELRTAGFLLRKEISDFGNWENDPDKQMWLLIGQLPSK